MLNKIKEYLVGIRKFSVMILIIIIAISFRLTDLISGAEMVELLKVTGAAFMAGNMVERIVEVVKERMK